MQAFFGGFIFAVEIKRRDVVSGHDATFKQAAQKGKVTVLKFYCNGSCILFVHAVSIADLLGAKINEIMKPGFCFCFSGFRLDFATWPDCAFMLKFCAKPMPRGKSKKVVVGAKRKLLISAIDLFCGVGGLTRGLIDEGINVVVGVDIDEASKYPYEKNNGTIFLKKDMETLKPRSLSRRYPRGHFRVLVGCAPCQPFSKYTQGQNTQEDAKWFLLRAFARLVEQTKPDVVSMENVPELERHSIFTEFVSALKKLEYHVSYSIVFCPNYGVPQQRSRLVLFASKLGPIKIVKPTHKPENYRTVKDAIGHLPRLWSGKINEDDPLHRCSSLSPLNLERIRASLPGGTWRDWPRELVADCHKEKTGKTYSSVYGRMEWDQPSPTITTQFFGFGNGRFGHPSQSRAISLREGAILQSFPADYVFVKMGGEYAMKTIGKLIGNAVPVRLGRAVGRTIVQHLKKYEQ